MMDGRGHRALPHTADVRIEAWAPTREECVAEAVHALVDTFASVPDADAVADVEPASMSTAVRSDEDALVVVLDEVIYLVDTRGVPVGVEVEFDGKTLRAEFALVPVESVEIIGAAPKAVPLHGLRFAPGTDGWSCEVLIDV